MSLERHQKGPTRLTELTPRQVARDCGLPLSFPRRKQRRGVNAAPSWDKLLDWAAAYWERQGRSDAA